MLVAETSRASSSGAAWPGDITLPPPAPSMQPVQMTPAVVVRQDLRVRLAGGGHPDRPHLAHPDPVAEPRAAEHERLPVARHLEQRRLEPAEQPADVQITRDLD